MTNCINHYIFTLHPLADLQYYIIWLMFCKILNEGHLIVHISLCLQNWLARFGDRLPLRAPEACRVCDVTQELHRIGNQLNNSLRAGNVKQRLSSFLQSLISRQDFVLKFQTVFHFKCQLLEKKVCMCVCMYVYMYVFMYVCMYVRRHVCMYVRVCEKVCMYVSLCNYSKL